MCLDSSLKPADGWQIDSARNTKTQHEPARPGKGTAGHYAPWPHFVTGQGQQTRLSKGVMSRDAFRPEFETSRRLENQSNQGRVQAPAPSK